MVNNNGVLIGVVLVFGMVSALKVRIQVPQREKVMSQGEIQELLEVRLMVDGNGVYIYPEQPNVFEIPSLSPGVHIIEAISNKVMFPVLMIDRRGEGAPKMRWLNPLDRKLIKTVNEPVLSPIERIKYFQPEGGFAIFSFLAGGNGLFLLMGVLMVVCYKFMPKIDQAQMAPQRPVSS